jgi:heme/copper-type cytochrome/quinol oxidase subunit 2
MRNHSKTPWIVAALAVLLLLFFPLPVHSSAPTERTFEIHASRFEYAPAGIRVNPGDRITIKLISTDVVHGLSIDGYDLEMTADPGQTESLSFVADRAGTFRFRCNTTCGNMHPFMIGKLYVGQNTLFWRAVALAGLLVSFGIWKLWK